MKGGAGMKGWITLVLGLLLVGLATARTTYTGYSGSPGRQTCANSCHGGNNGTVAITGFPTLYTPGTPYTVTIARSTGSSINSFNASCRVGTGTTNAGVLGSGTRTTTYNTSGETNGVKLSTYNQTSATFTWTAPAAGTGTVRLYVGAFQGTGQNSGQTTELTLVSNESVPNAPVLAVSSSTVQTSDGDTQAENGETVSLGITLANTGTVTATGVTGTLSESSTYLSVTGATATWPSIAAGQSATSSSTFTLEVSTSLPQNTTVPLTLAVVTDQGPFNLSLNLGLVYVASIPVLNISGTNITTSDGDALAENGEVVALTFTLANSGTAQATGITGTLVESSNLITPLNASSTWPNLAIGQSAQATVPITLAVSPTLGQDTVVPFTLQVSTTQGSFNVNGNVTLTFVPPPPDVAVASALVQNDSDGDGVWEPGEDVALSLSLANNGPLPLSDVVVSLGSLSGHVQVVGPPVSWSSLPAQSVTPAMSPYLLHLGEDATAYGLESLTVNLVCAQGADSASCALQVGRLDEYWLNTVESGAAGWTHSAAAGWNDQWHIEATGSGSPTHAWRCGPNGGGVYAHHQDARLVSPPLELRPYSRLEFQHSMSAEDSFSAPDSAYDGGVVEITVDGGLSWQQLTPLDGYDHWFRAIESNGGPVTHPFPGLTPCFSGVTTWETERVDLGAYADQTVQLAFHFGSDDFTALQGWILDDIRLIGLHMDDVALAPQLVPGGLELLPASPNPFNPSTTLRWRQAQAGSTTVELFNLQGQRVEVLASGPHAAGLHQVVVDGSTLASGAYLLRVETAGTSQTQKILLLK